MIELYYDEREGILRELRRITKPRYMTRHWFLVDIAGENDSKFKFMCGCKNCCNLFKRVPLTDLPLYLNMRYKSSRFFELIEQIGKEPRLSSEAMLNPNYSCCLCNLRATWPRFLEHL
jgi:hypothetical protein